METSAETFNPVIVEFYERIGFLPEALVNYLLSLQPTPQQISSNWFNTLGQSGSLAALTLPAYFGRGPAASGGYSGHGCIVGGRICYRNGGA